MSHPSRMLVATVGLDRSQSQRNPERQARFTDPFSSVGLSLTLFTDPTTGDGDRRRAKARSLATQASAVANAPMLSHGDGSNLPLSVGAAIHQKVGRDVSSFQLVTLEICVRANGDASQVALAA
jgi:hypothetical protein